MTRATLWRIFCIKQVYLLNILWIIDWAIYQGRRNVIFFLSMVHEYFLFAHYFPLEQPGCFIFFPHKSQWLETEVYSCSKWRLNIFYQSQTKCTERRIKSILSKKVFVFSNFAHLSLKTQTDQFTTSGSE